MIRKRGVCTVFVLRGWRYGRVVDLPEESQGYCCFCLGLQAVEALVGLWLRTRCENRWHAVRLSVLNGHIFMS